MNLSVRPAARHLCDQDQSLDRHMPFGTCACGPRGHGNTAAPSLSNLIPSASPRVGSDLLGREPADAVWSARVRVHAETGRTGGLS